MTDLFLKFKDLAAQSPFFWFCALLGSGLFLLQFLLSFFGGLDEDSDADGLKIKWLSKQGITGFLMMFGWSALTCQNQFHLPLTLTLPIAIASGAVTVFVTGLIFKMARKLHSPGTIFNLDDAIGKEATVYQRIPKNGIGKISLSLNQMTHEIDAVTENGEEIPSFAPVRILKKIRQ